MTNKCIITFTPLSKQKFRAQSRFGYNHGYNQIVGYRGILQGGAGHNNLFFIYITACYKPYRTPLELLYLAS